MSENEFGEGVALVVGGSGGVGAAVCARFAAMGTGVVLTYRGNEEGAANAAAAVRGQGQAAEVRQLDLTDATAVKGAVDEVAAQHGAIHTVVHAVGADFSMQFISEVEPGTWREVIEADAGGFFHLVHAALPHLREHGGGSIVTIGSAGLSRFPTRDILSVAPKAAIAAVVSGIAKEEGRFNVRANTVALGVIDTGIFHRLQAKSELTSEWLDAARRNTPLRRFGTAEEVADAVAFLASSRASYITGQTLVLDGGYSV